MRWSTSAEFQLPPRWPTSNHSNDDIFCSCHRRRRRQRWQRWPRRLRRRRWRCRCRRGRRRPRPCCHRLKKYDFGETDIRLLVLIISKGCCRCHNTKIPSCSGQIWPRTVKFCPDEDRCCSRTTNCMTHPKAVVSARVEEISGSRILPPARK